MLDALDVATGDSAYPNCHPELRIIFLLFPNSRHYAQWSLDDGRAGKQETKNISLSG